jgi:uncharacterized membrane protein YgcG
MIKMKRIMIALALMLTVGLTACRQAGEPQQATPAAVSENAEQVNNVGATMSPEGVSEDDAWTFATVPMPPRGNPPHFVTNPDGVLSPEAEAELNRILLYAKVELGIESLIVVVNHVSHADVESFAYALFDNFEHNDHMMVIVMAYEDHGVRMEIGHELENRLSEIECQQLLDQLLIPYLREDNPDEGMLSLVEGIYHKLENKQTRK